MTTQSFPEPLADPINVASKRMGISRATAYNQLAAGLLTARKAGRRTLILRSEQERWLLALPVKAGPAILRDVESGLAEPNDDAELRAVTEFRQASERADA